MPRRTRNRLCEAGGGGRWHPLGLCSCVAISNLVTCKVKHPFAGFAFPEATSYRGWQLCLINSCVNSNTRSWDSQNVQYVIMAEYIHAGVCAEKQPVMLLCTFSVCMLTRSSCLTLCDPMDCHPPGSSMSVGFSRQEYWSGLPFPSPGDLPDPGSNLRFLRLLHWQVGSLP